MTTETATITITVRKANYICAALFEAGEPGLSNEFRLQVEAALKEQRDAAESKRKAEEAIAEHRAKEERRQAKRLALRKKRDEMRKLWKREVLKHCRHLNASRMAWVMNKESHGMHWNGSTKGHMAEAIIDYLSGTATDLGSARLLIPAVEEVNARSIEKAMLVFRLALSTKNESGLLEDDIAAVRKHRDVTAQKLKTVTDNTASRYGANIIERRLQDIDRALQSLQDRMDAADAA